MSDLTLTFQDGRGTYSLVPNRLSATGPVYASITDVLQSDNDTEVCKAETSDGLRLVKLAFSEKGRSALKREASAYYELVQDFMGTDIPIVYGSYDGKDDEGKKIACIVVQYLTTLDAETNIPKLPLFERREIAEHLGRLHLAGVLPVIDLGGGNVGKVEDGSFRIGHLQDLQRHDPPCDWDGNWHFNEAPPELETFKCDALYEAGKEMGIWRTDDLSSMIVSQTTVVNSEDGDST